MDKSPSMQVQEVITQQPQALVVDKSQLWAPPAAHPGMPSAPYPPVCVPIFPGIVSELRGLDQLAQTNGVVVNREIARSSNPSTLDSTLLAVRGADSQLLYTLKNRSVQGTTPGCCGECECGDEGDRLFHITMKDALGVDVLLMEETTGCWSRGTPICATDAGAVVHAVLSNGDTTSSTCIGRIQQTSAMFASSAFDVCEDGAGAEAKLWLESHSSCLGSPKFGILRASDGSQIGSIEADSYGRIASGTLARVQYPFELGVRQNGSAALFSRHARPSPTTSLTDEGS